MKAKANQILPISLILGIAVIVLIQTFTGAATNTGGTRLVDTCNGNILTDYYVEGGYPMYKTVTCQYGCTSGACKAAPAWCTDSDSITTGTGNAKAGVVYTAKGTCTDSIGNDGTDVCIGDMRMTEYYCGAASNKCEYTYYNCPTGTRCRGGKCVSSCEDTDDPSGTASAFEYLAKKGTCTDLDGGGGTDECYDSKTVRENYCGNGRCTSILNGCSPGEICSNGACVVAQATCTDSDSGINYNKLGTCTDSAGAHTDFCSSGYNAVKDYYCAANNMCALTSYHYCTCSGGACV